MLNRNPSANNYRYVKPFRATENPEAELVAQPAAVDALSILVSMLNFCRFNYKLQEKLKKVGGTHNQTEDLLAYLQSDLRTKMALHDHILRTKSNLIQAKNW